MDGLINSASSTLYNPPKYVFCWEFGEMKEGSPLKVSTPHEIAKGDTELPLEILL